MASFQKRGKKWQFTISRIINDKSVPIRKSGFNTKKEAQVAAAEIESEMRKGVTPNLKAVPFAVYFKSWLDLYKVDIANNTLERYKNTSKTIESYFNDTAIQSITKRSYQAFLNEYGKKHAKDTTRKLNTHIRGCVKDAVDEGLIRVDFTRSVTLSGDIPKKLDSEKHLSYEDSQKLLKALYERLDQSNAYYLLLLALTTGMRFAEIVGLQRKDFDFASSTLTINKSWGYTNKMHKGFGKTKNEQSVRKIKIDQQTMQTFLKFFDNEPENIFKLVFYSPLSKYNVISNGSINKILKNLLTELKIDTISIHGLRHTHASVLLYKKVSIYYVAERLGHKDTQTTMQSYAHIIKELREEDEKSTMEIYQKMIV